MNQGQTELLTRAIKQTYYAVKRYFETGIGVADSLIRKLQRFEVLLSSITFQDESYQQQLMNILHDLTVELEEAEIETDTDTEYDDDAKTDEKESDDELPSIRINRFSHGMLHKA